MPRDVRNECLELQVSHSSPPSLGWRTKSCTDKADEAASYGMTRCDRSAQIAETLFKLSSQITTLQSEIFGSRLHIYRASLRGAAAVVDHVERGWYRVNVSWKSNYDDRTCRSHARHIPRDAGVVENWRHYPAFPLAHENRSVRSTCTRKDIWSLWPE